MHDDGSLLITPLSWEKSSVKGLALPAKWWGHLRMNEGAYTDLLYSLSHSSSAPGSYQIYLQLFPRLAWIDLKTFKTSM